MSLLEDALDTMPMQSSEFRRVFATYWIPCSMKSVVINTIENSDGLMNVHIFVADAQDVLSANLAEGQVVSLISRISHEGLVLAFQYKNLLGFGPKNYNAQ